MSIPLRIAADGVYEISAADLFCGAGGTSTGLVQAVEELQAELGVEIRLSLVAVNHWDVAIETHSANHKFAMHRCSGLKGVRPKDVIPGACDLLVASPECTHHSNARGGKPMDDQSRSSGDDVVRWIRELRPAMVVIENVREYRTWGPLNKDNRPIKSRKGEYFQKFLADIRALGYSTEDRLLCAADYGDPTTRTRLFVYCKRGGGPIAWPAATHAKAPERLLTGSLAKWRTAREDVIDWQDLGLSIFNRKKPLSPNTMRRIEAGLKKFSGIDLGGYLVKLYGTSDVASAGQPVPTVTGGGQHLGLAVPFILPQNGSNGPRDVNRPAPVLTTTSRGVGLAQPFQIRTDCTGGKTAGVRGIDEPAATVVGSGGLGVVDPQGFIVTASHGVHDVKENDRRAKSADEPLGTVSGSNDHGVAQPFLLGQQSPAAPRSTEEPVPTIAGRGAIAKVEPFMVAHFGERPGQEPRATSVDQPTPVVTSRGAAELVQPFLSEYHATQSGKERVRPVDEPIPTLDCSNRFGLAEPYMLSAGGPEVAPRSVDDPAHTVLTRDHIGVASPFIAGAGGPVGQGRPQSVDEPLQTVIGENHRAVIVPVTHPTPEGAADTRARSVDAPLPTITGAHRGEIGVAQAFLVQYQGSSSTQSVDGPMPTLTTKPKFALLVTFTNGERCLLDILFRMLRPRELARAQSFPDSYKFMGKTEAVVKQIGNAVPVKIAKALCKTAVTQAVYA